MFSVSTAAKASKANGASLVAKLTYPSGSLGTQANISVAKFELPRQLPSRLTTIQKACVAKVFEANPAGCPAASAVGRVVVHTPILPVALTGPAYLVSHGGEAFPQLVMVLQGYGVTLDVAASIFISKAGITSITVEVCAGCSHSLRSSWILRWVLIRRWRLTCPRRRKNFCGQNLVMPTSYTAQNGNGYHPEHEDHHHGLPQAQEDHQTQEGQRQEEEVV